MLDKCKPLIVCLMGPTASGKTKTALGIAREIPCEIISVDSAMVYRFMNIGTAKPNLKELAEVPHHLIDIRDPAEIYSAAQFRQDATQLIDNILSKNKTPLLVGGTMLYFRALQQGLSDLPQANLAIRKGIEAQANLLGWAKIHARLAKVDPEAASRISPTDPQRIQRALEVYEITGKSMTELWQEHQEKPLEYNIINLSLLPSLRSVLHERISLRFEEMLRNGFIDEVNYLYSRGDLQSDLPAIRSVGYRQAWEYLQGKVSYVQMKNLSIIATRQLAKRQLTWLRRWDNMLCFDSEDKDVCKKILHHLSTLSTKL